jgi:large subunit ribosomal protein L30
LVVNLHGQINVPRATRETLVQLGLGKRFSATVVGDDPVSKGAVHLCKDYVAWAPIDAGLLEAILKARGRLSNTRTLDEEALKDMGYKTYADLAQAMIKGETSGSKELKPFFGLSPPRGGFKRSSRRQFREGGILGENPKLGEIVRRML